jgi:hypothetical protein
LALHPEITRSPVFVAGCGHTGTTLMATILGSHSEIYTIPNETALFFGTDTPEEIWDFLETSRQRAAPDKVMTCEKTPPHVHCIDKIQRLFPAARIMLMVRDGRDVVASLCRRNLSVALAIDRWVHDTTATVAAMASPQVRIVKYEALVEDPVRVISAICAFVGVRFEERMLRFHEAAPHWFGLTETAPVDGLRHDDVRVLRNWQVHQPLFDGRGRWHAELGPADLSRLHRAGAGLMRQLGYDSADWR